MTKKEDQEIIQKGIAHTATRYQEKRKAYTALVG